MAGQWLSQDSISAASDRSMVPVPAFRDQLDAARSMWYKTPEAQYADGYLGTIDANRRQDRMRALVNVKTYARGPQAGDQVDPKGYVWTDEVNMTIGIEMEAQGLRFTQQGTYAKVIAERAAQMSGVVQVQPGADRLMRFKPPWA